MTGQRRGIEVVLLTRSGTFDMAETRDRMRNTKSVGTVDIPFRAVALQVGWSGRFSGVSLPWQ